MKDEKTSAEVAKIAARGIKDPGSLSPEEIARVCASALTQTPNKNDKDSAEG